MLMSPKSLNRDTRHHAYYRQRRKRTKKKPSEESPSRCTRMTTDWDFLVGRWEALEPSGCGYPFLQVIF